MLHYGFTGSQDGMTVQQLVRLRELLSTVDEEAVLHHGVCVGSDAQAHDEALRLPNWGIALHPGVDHNGNAPKRAQIFNLPTDKIVEHNEPLPYHERNQVIVRRSSFMIATPSRPEYLRSGTWSTVRFARKLGKHGVIITGPGVLIPFDLYVPPEELR